MITRFEIRNFKAFKHADVQFNRLTVLTGFNSSGKSSIIQAILLANIALSSASDVVPLNGPFGLELGEATDVLNKAALENAIGLTLAIGDSDIDVALEVPEERALFLRRTSSVGGAPVPRLAGYLSAERLGPRDLLEVSASDTENTWVGHRGQFTAHVLASRERMQVREGLRHPGATESDAITLSSQAAFWLSSIVRPIQIDAAWIPDSSAAKLRFREPGMLADWVRPANVGFGLSYALPILVAGLTANPGELLIVENPEAHIHPAGQSLLGRFLARLAGEGVQVIVETHSEHVVNGIRVALASEGVLTPGEVVVHFLDGSRVASLEISSSGKFSEWPAGFFDQAESDLTVLSRVARAR